MITFVHVVNRRQNVRRRLRLKGEAETLRVDFSPWQEDVNQTINSVTWEVVSGNATISNQALSSNIASALVTTTDTGHSLIKVTADTSQDDAVEYIELLAKEPNVNLEPDYWRCYG